MKAPVNNINVGGGGEKCGGWGVGGRGRNYATVICYTVIQFIAILVNSVDCIHLLQDDSTPLWDQI